MSPSPPIGRAAIAAALVVAACGLMTACEPVPTCAGRTPTIVGTSGPDDLEGTSGPDVIVGLAGNDLLQGMDGDDVICGGAGDDHLVGHDGADVLDGEAGSDIVDGSYGADTLNDTGTAPDETNHLRPGPGVDIVRGGAGRDTIAYDDHQVAVTVDLSTGRATTYDGIDTVSAVEDVRGGEGDDVLTGHGGRNVLEGGGGADVMTGLGGDDTAIGGAGVDRISFARAPRSVNADLSTGRATGEGLDTLTGIEHLEGGPHPDTLSGDAFTNHIDGAGGHDVCRGNGGGDTLISCP